MNRKRLLICFCLMLTVAVPMEARKRRANNRAQTDNLFDHYVLALSWAPNFCATHRGNARECGTGRHVGFVVHGLWPQQGSGRMNAPCQNTSPVSQDIVNQMLDTIPDAGLIQHEWSCHGTYSGLSAAEYFSSVRKAFASIRVPDRIKALKSDAETSGDDLLREFSEANSSPQNSFSLSCHDGELVAVEACLSKDLKLQSCGDSSNRCQGKLLLRAPH